MSDEEKKPPKQPFDKVPSSSSLRRSSSKNSESEKINAEKATMEDVKKGSKSSDNTYTAEEQKKIAAVKAGIIMENGMHANGSTPAISLVQSRIAELQDTRNPTRLS